MKGNDHDRLVALATPRVFLGTYRWDTSHDPRFPDKVIGIAGAKHSIARDPDRKVKTTPDKVLRGLDPGRTNDARYYLIPMDPEPLLSSIVLQQPARAKRCPKCDCNCRSRASAVALYGLSGGRVDPRWRGLLVPLRVLHQPSRNYGEVREALSKALWYVVAAEEASLEERKARGDIHRANEHSNYHERQKLGVE